MLEAVLEKDAVAELGVDQSQREDVDRVAISVLVCQEGSEIVSSDESASEREVVFIAMVRGRSISKTSEEGRGETMGSG